MRAREIPLIVVHTIFFSNLINYRWIIERVKLNEWYFLIGWILLLLFKVMPALLTRLRPAEDGWSKPHADDLVEKLFTATFPAFKFPDRERLHVSCGVQLCKGACPNVSLQAAIWIVAINKLVLFLFGKGQLSFGWPLCAGCGQTIGANRSVQFVGSDGAANRAGSSAIR